MGNRRSGTWFLTRKQVVSQPRWAVADTSAIELCISYDVIQKYVVRFPSHHKRSMS